MSVTKQITRSGCSVQITLDDGGEVEVVEGGQPLYELVAAVEA